MSSQIKQGKLQAALAFVLIFGMAASDHIVAQSDTRQDSGTANADPFQLPATAQDPFQLPGIPPLPSQNPVAQAGRGSFQRALVNEKYAGWRQASDGSMGARLDEVLRAQWIMADETGKLPGTVFGIDGADIGNLTIYLLNNGREVTSVRPKEDGTFVFSNVRQGTYSLVGWGDNAFFAFALNILRFNQEANENVETELKITATQNETTINTDWIQFFASQVEFPVYGRYETGEGETDPARLYGGGAQQIYLPPSRPATSISSHEVIPASDGRFIGRVHQMSTRHGRPVDLRNTRIMLLKDDDVFAAVSTDSYGIFEFPEIPAGEYSCVAVGKDGLGCIGIYLGEPATTEDEYAPLSFAMTTSETTGWLNDLARETAYQRVVSRERINLAEPELYGDFGNGGGCPGPGKLRPGGYRPQPRSAIPKDQRFFNRANRFIDGLFFSDERGGGANTGGGAYGNGGGGYYGNTGGGSYGSGGGGYYGNGGGYGSGSYGPAATNGIIGGPTSRNPVPTSNRK